MSTPRQEQVLRCVLSIEPPRRFSRTERAALLHAKRTHVRNIRADVLSQNNSQANKIFYHRGRDGYILFPRREGPETLMTIGTRTFRPPCKFAS